MSLPLPEGYRERAGTPDDIPELAVLDAAYTKSLFGRALQTEGEIRTEWKAPHFDPETDSRLVVALDGRIVAWTEVYDFEPHVTLRSRLRVAFESARPEIAQHLIAWCVERARNSVEKAPPGTRVAFTQSAFEADAMANERLLGAGMTPVRVFLRMQIEMSEPPDEPVWPDGVTVRSFIEGQDDTPAIEALRDVFRDHWGFVETPLEDDLEEWRQWIYEDEDFDTDLWFLAIDAGEIVGFCQCYPVAGDDPRIGLVDELGVRRSHRGRGLATALLLHTFGAFYERGKPIVDLGVDAESLTGATRLYEQVGMRVVRRNNVYELDLRPGVDITTRG